MSGFHATIDRSQFDAAMRRVEQGTASMSGAMEQVSEKLYQFVLNTFRDQTDPWGHPWAPWAPATAAARKRKGDLRIQKLIDSGDLYRSIHKESSDKSASVFAGEGLEYAEVQQFGNNRIPARPFFPMRSEDDGSSFPQEWLDAVFAPIQAAINEMVQ